MQGTDYPLDSISLPVSEAEARELRLKSEALDAVGESIMLREFQNDTPGKLVYFNQAAYKTRGYTYDEFFGMRLEDYIAPADKEAQQQRVNELKQKREMTFENSNIRKDGSKFPVEAHIKIIEIGQKQYLISIIHDISERQLDKEKLLREREEFKKLVEELPVGVGIVNLEGQAILRNTYLQKMYGYDTKEELTKIPIAAHYYDPADRERFLKLVSHGPVLDFKVRLKRKDGTSFWASIASLPYFSENGEQQFFSVINDITERKKAEEELELKARLLDAATDAIFLRDFDEGPLAKFLYVNKAACTTFDYSRNDLMQLTMRDLSPSYQSEFVETRKKQLVGSEEITLEFMLRCKNGVLVPVESHASIIVSDSRRYILTIVHDITNRGKTEEALRTSEEKYRNLFETMRQGVVYYNTEGKAIEANPAAEKILGNPFKSPAMFLMGSGEKAFREDGSDFPSDLQPIAMALKTGHEISNIIMRRLNPNGTYQWLRVSAHPLVRKGENRLYRLYSTIEDITQIKNMEEELKLKASLLDTASDAIYLRRLNGQIVYMNDSAVKTFGYSWEEMRSLPLPQLIDPERLQVFKARMEETIVRGQAKYETNLRRRNKVPIPVEVNSRLIKFNDEQYILSLSRDITERKRDEAIIKANYEKLQSLASELFLAEERERRRIAIEIHDRLSQTLALCDMKIKELTNLKPLAPFRVPLVDIQLQLESLIDEARSLTFDLSSPLLYELGLDAALDKLLEEYQQKFSITCNLHTPSKSIIMDEEIRILLFQASRELITNVVKHASAKNIDVNLMKRNNRVYLTVKDDGIGFNFEKENGNKTKVGGFGIFSIRERLRYLNGSMRIVSRDGQGTSVTLIVPLVKNTAKEG